MFTSPRIFALAATLAAGTALAVPLPVHAATGSGNGEEIHMSYPDYDSDLFISEIYRQMVAELGYSMAKPIVLSGPTPYPAVAQGDTDFFVNAWFPLNSKPYETVKDDAVVVGEVAHKGAIQGFMVDKKSAEKYHIKTLDDFKRPEVAKAFDRNGDGKPDMVGCQLGWSCEAKVNDLLTDLKLKSTFNLIKAKYVAAFAEMEAAYQAGDPILYYAWTPNWTSNELVAGKDVEWVSVPQRKGVDLPAAEKNDACTTNPCRFGFAANTISAVANRKFIAKHPDIRKLLEEAHVPVADINKQNAEMHAGDRNVKKQAAEWIKANRSEVDTWLSAARAARKTN